MSSHVVCKQYSGRTAFSPDSPTHTSDDTGFNWRMLEYILTCNGTFTMHTLDRNTEIINIQLLITLEIVSGHLFFSLFVVLLGYSRGYSSQIISDG